MQANDSLLHQCIQLNDAPVTQLSRTANLVTNDDIDPDDNFYNGLNVDSVYYTEDELHYKIISKLLFKGRTTMIQYAKYATSMGTPEAWCRAVSNTR